MISSASHLNAAACVVALLGGGSEYDCDLLKVQRAAHDAHLFEFASIDVWEARLLDESIHSATGVGVCVVLV